MKQFTTALFLGLFALSAVSLFADPAVVVVHPEVHHHVVHHHVVHHHVMRHHVVHHHHHVVHHPAAVVVVHP